MQANVLHIFSARVMLEGGKVLSKSLHSMEALCFYSVLPQNICITYVQC